MKLLPVTALSSWVYCPRQFFVSSVLAVEEPPRDVMILGLLKHKLCEHISTNEERLVMSLQSSEGAQQEFESAFTSLLRSAVKTYASALRRVNVPLPDAFQKAMPLVKFEAAERAARIQPLLNQGLRGQELWESVSPKVKVEYGVQSEKLGLKGRIDRLEVYGDRVVPVELKSGSLPEGVRDEHRIQVAAYALLLEEKFSCQVPEAVVQYVDHNARRPVVLNPFLREHVQDIHAQVRECLDSQELPKGCGRESCSACRRCEDAQFVRERLKQRQ